MTKPEDEEKGVLTIDVNFKEFAQAINNFMYMGQKLKDKLEIAAMEKGIQRKERRKSQSDRRKL